MRPGPEAKLVASELRICLPDAAHRNDHALGDDEERVRLVVREPEAGFLVLGQLQEAAQAGG
eukprot:1495867-Alexandrium_andersonii.AAC.1